MSRFDSRCTACHRSRGVHPWDNVDTGEGCQAFVQRVVDPAKKRRGLRAVKAGRKNEGIALKAGPGRMDIATEDAAIEVKTGTATIRRHIQQARRLAGNREAVVRYVWPGEVWDLREVRTEQHAG